MKTDKNGAGIEPATLVANVAGWKLADQDVAPQNPKRRRYDTNTNTDVLRSSSRSKWLKFIQRCKYRTESARGSFSELNGSRRRRWRRTFWRKSKIWKEFLASGGVKKFRRFHESQEIRETREISNLMFFVSSNEPLLLIDNDQAIVSLRVLFNVDNITYIGKVGL